MPPGQLTPRQQQWFAAIREGWSERLTAVCVLAGPEAVDNDLAALLRLAWSRS